MRERHQIYLRRAAGEPPPWTDDPILRDNRFCNVFRELDTVTIWIRKNIRERYAHHPDLWFMLAIARYINWPDTLHELMIRRAWPEDDSFDPSQITKVLEARAARGEKVYTGAYMIRAESDPKAPWYSWSKHRYIAEIVLGRLWEDRVEWRSFLGTPYLSLSAVWSSLSKDRRYVGWGPFMSYEVVTDLRHTRYLRDAPDIMLWANAGPGAIRGLNRLAGRPLKAQPGPDTTLREMQEILSRLKVATPLGWPELEMRDVEHSLCEFDKYQRVLLGEGKMRSKYRPTTL